MGRPRSAPVLTGLAALGLSLASCGASSATEQITAVLRDVGQHPADLCTRYATPALLQRAGGDGACRRAAAAPDAVDAKLSVLSVKVTGLTATAQIRGRSGTNTISLVKLGTDWKVSNSG